MLRTAISLFLSLMLLTSTTVAGHQGLTDATNVYRSSLGLTTLDSDSTLDAFAAQRSQEIVNNFNHAYWWADQVCWRAMGENLAFANDSIIQPTGLSVELFFINQWANSPAHYTNMVGNYTRIGTAINTVGDTHYAVQIFWLPCEAGPTIVVPPVPAPVIIDPPIPYLPDTATLP